MKRRNQLTRILAALMALSLALALSACGGSGDTPDESPTPPVEEQVPDPILPEEQPMDEESNETEQMPNADILLLSFDFPNNEVRDDGTNNAPNYTVTLHGGAEVELQKGVETQIVKLDGLGTISDSSNVVSVPNIEGLLEVTFDVNLSVDDIVAAFREALDLRDDVAVEIYNIHSGDVVCPGEFESVEGGDAEYGHMIAGASIVAYNETAADIPIMEAPIGSVTFVTTPHDDSMATDLSPAADVYARFGEPACVRVSWDDSQSTLKSVDYYWQCNGFYVQYSVLYFGNAGSSHGSGYGSLRCILDEPTVVEHYMSDAAAFMAG